MLRQLYFVCEGVLQCNVRFDAENLNVAISPTEAVQVKKGADVTTDYRGAAFCIVSSLHDGMNLVAKEFVAAQVDEQGMLILSQFTGAATELPDALIINPYNIDQCAAALHLALTMSPTKQRTRMHSMRGIVQEFNVYRWAGRMLMDAARMRQQARFVRQMGVRDARTTTGGQV